MAGKTLRKWKMAARADRSDWAYGRGKRTSSDWAPSDKGVRNIGLIRTTNRSGEPRRGGGFLISCSKDQSIGIDWRPVGAKNHIYKADGAVCGNDVYETTRNY
jgi:hypothetical protein